MNFPFFIARRIYTDKGDRKKVSRPVIRIATAGVATGLAVMIVAVCVVLGFKHAVRDKIAGFAGHVTVADFLTLQTAGNVPVVGDDSLMSVLRKMPLTAHVQRYAMKQGILKTDSDFYGVVFKGVAEEYDTVFLHQHLTAGEIPHFSDSASSNKILISRLIADKLHLDSGQRVFAYFFDGNNVRMRRFTVSGIYETNLKRYDETVCFADLSTTVRLNGWEKDQVSGIEMILTDFSRLEEAEQEVRQRVDHTQDRLGETYSSATVQELNPQTFSWLELLDLNIWVILGLMTAVAAITMISGLLIIILERTQMIGLMKALGARGKSIRKTFLWFAAFIIGKGLIVGDILGIGLVLLQKVTGIFRLDAATYYVDRVPVELNLPLVLLLNVATLAVCMLVLWLPSLLVAQVHPARSMRYE